MRWVRLSVAGMGCRACVREVTSLIRDIPGVDTLHVDLNRGTITVDGDFLTTDLHAAIERAELTITIVAQRDGDPE